jgi:2'-5' RNA ligase
MLPKDVQSALSKHVQALRPLTESVTWVAPDNLHVTVKFLGDVREQDVAELSRAIQDVSREHANFALGIQGCGAFPDLPRPRTLWAGIGEGMPAMIRVGEDVEEACVTLGYRAEHRRYRPHVTLGRVRGGLVHPSFANRLAETATQLRVESFQAQEITLYSSLLDPRGPTYVPLATAEFAS